MDLALSLGLFRSRKPTTPQGLDALTTHHSTLAG